MEVEERRAFKELLGKQNEVYGTMRNLLRAQLQAFKAGDTEKLMVLVNEVNDLRVKTTQLQVEVTPLKEKWESDRDSIPQDERDVLLKKVEGIREVLAEVLELMNSLKTDVADCKDETQDRIRDVQRAAAARRGYGTGKTPPPQSSRFMDRKE